MDICISWMLSVSQMVAKYFNCSIVLAPTVTPIRIAIPSKSVSRVTFFSVFREFTVFDLRLNWTPRLVFISDQLPGIRDDSCLHLDVFLL